MYPLSKERELFEAFPLLYGNRKNRYSPISSGILCGPGWYNIIWDLSKSLEAMLSVIASSDGDDHMVPRAIEVRERDGVLKYVIGPKELVTQDMLELINHAESRSLITCELCGAEATRVFMKVQYYSLCSQHTASFV